MFILVSKLTDSGGKSPSSSFSEMNYYANLICPLETLVFKSLAPFKNVSDSLISSRICCFRVIWRYMGYAFFIVELLSGALEDLSILVVDFRKDFSSMDTRAWLIGLPIAMVDFWN